MLNLDNADLQDRSELSPIKRSDTQSRKSSRIIAPWLLSLLFHSALVSTAMITANVPSWTNDVARGRSVQLTVALGATASNASTQSPSVELPIEETPISDAPTPILQPRKFESRVVTKKSVAQETAYEVGFNAAQVMTPVSLPDVVHEVAQRAKPPADLPEVRDVIEPRVHQRHVASASISGPILPTSIDQVAGASVEEPPTPDPQNSPPVYPAAAQREQRQGRVVLAVRIDDQGVVASISVSTSSGHPDLDEAAMQAVLRWKFAPGKSHGKVVAADVHIPIKFTIRPSSQS